jgi:hypothetical protein
VQDDAEKLGCGIAKTLQMLLMRFLSCNRYQVSSAALGVAAEYPHVLLHALRLLRVAGITGFRVLPHTAARPGT